MDPLSDIERDDLVERPYRPATGLAVLTGLLATAAGAAVGIGLFQDYTSKDPPLRSAPPLMPDWRVYLGLAIALSTFGLAAMLFARTAFGRTCLGAVAVPALLLATVNAALGLRLDEQVRDQGLAALGLGSWLMLGGSAAALLAALLALGQLGGRGEPAASWPAPMFAVLGIGCLLYGWLVGIRVPPGSSVPVQASGYFATLTDPDVHGWTTAAVVAGLSLVVGAVGVATGRRGAVPAGVALGAAAGVAVDAGVRVYQLRTVPAGDAIEAGLVRNNVGLIAYGAAAVLLLMLAVSLHGRRWPEEEQRPVGLAPLPESEEFPRGPTYGGPGYGGSRSGADADYDADDADRPYQPGTFEQPRYLPEHDPAPGAHYPLVPDDRTARHPAPPRSGVGPSGG